MYNLDDKHRELLFILKSCELIFNFRSCKFVPNFRSSKFVLNFRSCKFVLHFKSCKFVLNLRSWKVVLNFSSCKFVLNFRSCKLVLNFRSCKFVMNFRSCKVVLNFRSCKFKLNFSIWVLRMTFNSHNKRTRLHNIHLNWKYYIYCPRYYTASLGIMGGQFRALLNKPRNTIVLWWSKRFQGVLQLVRHDAERRYSPSNSCTSARCSFPMSGFNIELKKFPDR